MNKFKINIENKNQLIDRIYQITSNKHDLVVFGSSSYSTPYNYSNDSLFNNLIKAISNTLYNHFNNSYRIEDMWFNIYKTGGYVKEHNHLSEKYKNLDFLTGVFYLKKPSNSGELYINKKEIKLKEDDFIIFDAKENHFSTENKSEEDKIVISFNFLKEKNTFHKNSTSWSFELDNVSSFAFYKKVFNKDECEKIVNIGKNRGLKPSTLMNKSLNDVEAKKVRSSNVSWLYPDYETDWIFYRVAGIVTDLNNKFFNFDISGLNEGFQFTNYTSLSLGDKYEKHIDKGYNRPVRKLSLSIQLTDPKEYEGGELFLYESEKGQKMSKEQGDLILFPSYLLHEVKPVTKGERNSLVAWITGRQFR